MLVENPLMEMRFVYSEPEIENGRFAIGLVPKETFAEVRQDYLQPILVNRFPLYLLHPDSVVHMVQDATLGSILRRWPTPNGVFVAVLPRRVSAEREATEQVLKQAGFAPLDDLQWQLSVGVPAA